MAKSTKKKNRRLRRQIRKTIGALFMASAVAVAAVPVQDVAANPEDKVTQTKVAVINSQASSTITGATVQNYKSTIPHAQERTGSEGTAEQIVYTSGDGTFQFVYMRPTVSDPNKVAVILGYNSGVRQDSSLTIPETLEAYRKYTDNTSRSGYCLVSKNDSFLYYQSEEQRVDDLTDGKMYRVPGIKDDGGNYLEVDEYNTNVRRKSTGEMVFVQMEDLGKKDEETGEPILEEKEYPMTPIMDTVYYPCYYEQRSEWKDVADTDLYYLPDGKDSTDINNYVQAKNNNDYWKINADVAYIGEEKIVDDGNGGWILSGYITEPNDGVFADQSNITNLSVGSNILGIGDYAFYGCSTLQNVTLANGLQTIGNGAFANCIRLEECNIASNANIQAIGKDAFYNCRTLRSFSAPIGLRALGDSCFEGCSSLETVDLCGGGGAVALRHLGDHLFKGCSSLTSIEFPNTYEENNLDIDMFEGCSSLQFVKITNDKVNFVCSHYTGDANNDGVNDNSKYPNCLFSWDTFKATVPQSFYFEGPAVSNIHDTASGNEVAFKYLGQDLYELIKLEVGEGGTGPGGKVEVTYQVNSQNELVKFWIETGGKPENVTIPETIGPYGISTIGQGSFNDNCYLKKVTIPASVIAIGQNAFKGCHNLGTVIFTDASTIQTIGTDAFKTQETTCSCKLDDNPTLTFVGAMMNNAGADTVPFMYAMNGVSNINHANQEKIWITCHSGWPTNLEVQYNFDPITGTGEAQLVGYPKFAMIKDVDSAKKWVADLPYVTSENKSQYESMVTNATTYYLADDVKREELTEQGKQPTENEMAIVNSSLNVVVPTSVDCIEPGLFSGYIPDKDGESDADNSAEWDKVLNFAQAGSATPNQSLPDTDIQTIVLNGVNEIDPFTFKNCTSLREAAVIGASYIDDYAFDGLDDDDAFTGDPEEMQLSSVTLGTNMADTGKRPFRGCENLVNINCMDSDFMYNNGVLYRNAPEGVEIVECLESRGATGGVGSYSVGPEELTGITKIKEEAFSDCDFVGKVDLSTTTVDVIPEGCFENTDDLNTVVLPDTVKNIEEDSFKDSKLRLLTIPGNQAYIAKDAFATSAYLASGNHDDQHTIIFECIEGTTADRYAKEADNWYINPEYGKVYLEYTVYFWDYPDYPDVSNKAVFHKVKVKDGEDAVPPITTPVHEGYQFSRWTDYTNISKDTDVYPVFGYNVYAVKFIDWDGKELAEVQYIEEGKSATPPADPVREGYTFAGWSQSFSNIKQDTTIVATYSDNSGDSSRHTVTFYDYDGNIHSQQSVNHGEAAVTPQNPVKEGYKFLGWTPSDYTNVVSDMSIMGRFERIVETDEDSDKDKDKNNNNNNNNGNSVSDNSADVKKYTVSVSGGSGSGSYAAGDIVAINAYFRGNGQSFDKWTTSTAGVGFANNEAASTTFTMPATNVAITATYKVSGGTASNVGTGGGTGGGGSTNSGYVNNLGSSVQITKPGISHTGLAGATVNGSTDNFIVKVTEDANATNAVVTALQTRYGDISRIKYWPVDITLYDSTGRTKIADTSGISVNLTLPIPDDFVQYAGNNKVAAVSGGVLEDLNTRFTTVDGVACVNFTATHFSPYVIYVDTANLTVGTIDSTPKTGDPIHPKWFLSVGMACIALILFFKRDKAVIPAKTA